MAIKQITLANFYAGISENRYFGAEKGQFQYCKNLDLQGQVRGMRLIADSVLSTDFNRNGNVVFMERLEDMFGSRSGFVCALTNGTLSDEIIIPGVLSTTSIPPGIASVANITLSGPGDCLYFFGTGRMDVLQFSGSVYTTSAETYSGAGFYRPTLNISGAVLMGAGNVVYSFTGAPVVVKQALLTLPSNEIIVGITRYSSEFRVYTRIGLSEGGGRQYTWDGASATPTSVVNWTNCPPASVVSNGAYDYVLAGKNDEFLDLYIATGTSKKIVKSGAVGGRGRRFSPKMKMCKDILYIYGSIDLTKSGATNRENCIFSYGSENAGFPESLQIETILDPVATENIDFGNFYPAEDNIFYIQGVTGSTETNKIRFIPKRREILSSTTSGKWISNTITGGPIGNVKNIKQITVGYSLENGLNQGGTINIYIRDNSYSNFTLIRSITDATVNFCDIFENEIPDNLSVFNEMEIQIELIRDGSQRSPIVYECIVIYDDNLRA